MSFAEYQAALANRGLETPPGLEALIDAPAFSYAEPWLLRSRLSADEAFSLLGDDEPDNLLPFAVVDERSVACVVCAPAEYPDDPGAGLVVRWHFDEIGVHQAAILDVGIVDYVASLEEELAAREPGLVRVLDEIGPAYEESHLTKEKRPRDYVVRPVRIACQNVIVGLGAIAQDSSFDGLSVPAWQTCEVPHVATHEANRAMAALTLCDAYQNGGTMEIRFDRPARIAVGGKSITLPGHPEQRVPASLRRFGRTVGVRLGAEDPQAITPAEARKLFLTVTPMPDELRERVDVAVEHRGIAPERICFLLLSQVWCEVEMDFLLASTARSLSILSGGADWTDRVSRQAESEICRAAITIGMLFRRLNATDGAAAADGEVRVVEDRAKGVTWSVVPDAGAVTFAGIDPAEPVPWTFGLADISTLTVFPRTAATEQTIEFMRLADAPGHKALLLPADAPVPAGAAVTVLRCPERLADIDKSVEDRLLKARISCG